MTTYNNVTENCFRDCINDFTSRKIQAKEVGSCTAELAFVRHVIAPPPLQITCSEHCVDKFIKMSQRVTMRLQEHFKLQMNATE